MRLLFVGLLSYFWVVYAETIYRFPMNILVTIFVLKVKRASVSVVADNRTTIQFFSSEFSYLSAEDFVL